MANPEHVEVVEKGAEAIRKWREANADTELDLRGALLDRVDLHQANLANLCNLTHAFLHEANLCGADLSGAKLVGTNFCQARLRNARLIGADLHRANLDRADLTGANLTGAILERAILVGTTVSQATFSRCRVYGASAWDIRGDELTVQNDLIITPHDAPEVTVDSLKVAQIIYLLLDNPEIRDVIDTITSKVVLILGRFTEERKRVLDAIREELRKHDRVPVMFDFDETKNQDITDTVTTLSRMARFIIADITDPRCIPHELMAIVPSQTSVPVQPLLLVGEEEYAMFKTIKKYPWVLPVQTYEEPDQLIRDVQAKIIRPAEDMVDKLRHGSG